MNIFEKILIFLDSSMKEPVSYGMFHITFLVLIGVSIILIRLKYNNLDIKKIKRALLVYAFVCLSLEVYKQINFSFNYDSVNTWWSYPWYIFPFQFCSTPMYIALIGALTNNKKLEEACFMFLATFGMLAGIAVMLYPVTVFVDTIGINYQTMIHHSLMVVVGVFIIINKQVNYNFKSFLKGLYVFIICIIIALILNISTYYLGISNGLEMFFISPFHVSSLPIFSVIYERVPYLIFLLIYILSFGTGSYLILKITSLFKYVQVKS